MLHLSFGQCRALLVLMEEIDGQWQGGTVSLPWNFQSGAMRGRVHPLDGQVYVTGLKGWTTRAADDGCLQRIRYTGKPICVPADVKTYANGLALTFTQPLQDWSLSRLRLIGKRLEHELTLLGFGSQVRGRRHVGLVGQYHEKFGLLTVGSVFNNPGRDLAGLQRTGAAAGGGYGRFAR